jgi:putative heme-binding domain-containing protein
LIEKFLSHPDEYVRAWTIQLMCESPEANTRLHGRLIGMASDDPSPLVRLYLASALQRLSGQTGWRVAEHLVRHAEDANDHNLPLMYWYGIEPLVPNDVDRAMALARSSAIPLLTRYVFRRLASEDESLAAVTRLLTDPDQQEFHALLLDEMLRAFEGRVDIPMPASWSEAYERLMAGGDASIRQRADQIAVLFGDKRIFPRLRSTLADASASVDRRMRALEILVRGRDQGAVNAFLAAVANPALRGPAVRALAAFDDDRIPEVLVEQYQQFEDTQRRDTISTLVSRPRFALALLDAVERKHIPRTDVHAYHVRQLSSLAIPEIDQRLSDVWGAVREPSAEKRQTIKQLEAQLSREVLARADLGNGRRIFAKTCATCHRLFGDGADVGPDITGSNRANLEYILSNVVDPSSVLGNDYRMTEIATENGQIISGLVQRETDSALTVRTINDTVVISKSEIEQRRLSSSSLMPDGLLAQMSSEEIRDLVGYLASPVQVPLRGPDAPLDPTTGRVSDAWEGESLVVARITQGEVDGQSMTQFPRDRWSGNSQLWWTGAAPGALLEMELSVNQHGTYTLETVLTMARDYGIVQLSLDQQSLGSPVDLYNDPDVVTTGVLSFEGLRLEEGTHRFCVEMMGANPRAVKAYMFGLDYLRLVPHVAE